MATVNFKGVSYNTNEVVKVLTGKDIYILIGYNCPNRETLLVRHFYKGSLVHFETVDN